MIRASVTAERTFPHPDRFHSMHRRAYLATTASAVGIATAGCLGDALGTPTPTPTPTPEPPEIEWVGPITNWGGGADIRSREVEAFGRGGYLTVGAEYLNWAHDGEVDVEAQLEVYDEGGGRVASETLADRQLTEGSGFQEWAIGVPIRTEGWDLAVYTGQLLIRDTILGETSSAAEWEVSLGPRLTADQATLEAYDGPSSVTPGESFNYSLTFTNNFDLDSSLASSVSTSYEGGEWQSTGTTIRVNILSGDTAEYQVTDVSLSQAGEYTYRIDDINETWTITAE